MVRTLPSQLSSFSQDHEMAIGQILSRQSLTSANDAFTLVHQKSLTSCDGRYVLTHQPDGTLAVYLYIAAAVWSDDSLGSGSRIMLDESGRLLVRQADGGTRVWVDGGVAEVILRNAGHLVAVDWLGTALWWSQIHDSLPGATWREDAPPWSGRHLRPFAGWFVQPSERHG